MAERFGVMVHTVSGPGVLHQLTGIVARRNGDISSVEIVSQADSEARVYFEIEMDDDPQVRIDDCQALSIVREVTLVKTLTDPVQAGVMTVMAIASTAKFTVSQLKRRVF